MLKIDMAGVLPLSSLDHGIHMASVLPLSSLDRGIRLLGHVGSYDLLFRRLHAKLPITIGVLGASVGQNAGCLSQPGKRCMQYGIGGARGVVGFVVRLLLYINASWPHPAHSIVNFALDGTGASHIAQCVVGHMPSRVDLIISEFGSMALHTVYSVFQMERIARVLLSRPQPPTLLHVAVHEWCSQRTQPRRLYRVGDVLQGTLRNYIYPDSPWAAVDDEAARVARHYGQASISVHAALAPHVLNHERGFDLLDVTGTDCLHPVNGRHGVDYVTALLTHWLDRAHALWRHSRTREGGYLLKGLPRERGPDGLPLPLHAINAERRLDTRCYAFVHATNVQHKAQMLMAKVAWCSAEGQRREATACWSAPQMACPVAIRHNERQQAAASDASTAAYESFMSSTPRAWFYCGVSLGKAKRKLSAGVLALRPGLELRAKVASFGSSAASEAEVHVEHLTSYEGMGKVTLECREGCSCAPQLIDAHKVSDVRNVSVYETHTFTAKGQQQGAGKGPRADGGLECEFVFTTSQETSSGGHKFKLRALTVVSTLPKVRDHRAPVAR